MVKGGNEKEEGRKEEGKGKKKKAQKIICDAALKFLKMSLVAFRPTQR